MRVLPVGKANRNGVVRLPHELRQWSGAAVVHGDNGGNSIAIDHVIEASQSFIGFGNRITSADVGMVLYRKGVGVKDY